MLVAHIPFNGGLLVQYYIERRAVADQESIFSAVLPEREIFAR